MSDRALHDPAGDAERTGPWRFRLGIVGLWTILAIFTASNRVLVFATSGRPLRWAEELASHLGAWYLWALLAIVVVRLGRRVPLERARWARAVALHLPASALLAFVHILIDYPLDRALGVPAAATFRSYVVGYYQYNVLTYWLILGVGSAFEYYRRYREREIRASQLEARLAEARLEALRHQLHPHFLFNALNAVSALMHRDVAAAERVLVRLSELLRTAIDGDGAQEVSLRRELEFVESYLDIMQVRFEGRLDVSMEIASEALDVPVPSLILQPLVENAVLHGVAPRPAGGRVTVRARLAGGRLELCVLDDGPGLVEPVEAAMRRGVGLANTRARLAQIYGDAHRFHVGTAAGGGAEARVTIPAAGPAPA